MKVETIMFKAAQVQKSRCSSLITAVLLAVALSGLVSTAFAEDAPSDQAKQGLELFKDFGCYQCHGVYGQGGNSGPKLAPDPLPFEAYNVIVRRPPAKMPPYTSKVLSDEQLRSIHFYLQSLEKTPPASEIDLLDLTIQPVSE